MNNLNNDSINLISYWGINDSKEDSDLKYMDIAIEKLTKQILVKDFITNKHFDNASNGDLFLNSINYLTGDVSLINIRPKQVTRREILATPNEFDVIRYTSWFVLPSLMALAGIGIWWVRR